MSGQTKPLPVSRLDTIGKACTAMSQTGCVVYGGRVEVVEFKEQGLAEPRAIGEPRTESLQLFSVEGSLGGGVCMVWAVLLLLVVV